MIIQNPRLNNVLGLMPSLSLENKTQKNDSFGSNDYDSQFLRYLQGLQDSLTPTRQLSQGSEISILAQALFPWWTLPHLQRGQAEILCYIREVNSQSKSLEKFVCPISLVCSLIKPVVLVSFDVRLYS